MRLLKDHLQKLGVKYGRVLMAIEDVFFVNLWVWTLGLILILEREPSLQLIERDAKTQIQSQSKKTKKKRTIFLSSSTPCSIHAMFLRRCSCSSIKKLRLKPWHQKTSEELKNQNPVYDARRGPSRSSCFAPRREKLFRS